MYDRRTNPLSVRTFFLVSTSRTWRVVCYLRYNTDISVFRQIDISHLAFCTSIRRLLLRIVCRLYLVSRAHCILASLVDLPVHTK